MGVPAPTPFHPRTSAHCRSLLWKDWAGHYAVRSYDSYLEREYHAFRHTAGLIDVTPLFKIEVAGPGAAALLARVMVRDVTRLKPGQVWYLCWCDDEGRVADDGTVARLEETRYRVTSAEPALDWLLRHSRGYDVRLRDTTEETAALSLQGPRSRDILCAAAGAGAPEVAALKYFHLTRARIGGVELEVSRTGYTGDLGYELWLPGENALEVYDAVTEAGEPYGLLPAGLDAMDITRIEAGYIMNGVDYFSAHHALTEERRSTPYELGLGWAVNLEREPFNGQEALRREKARGARRALVGLATSWEDTERLFAEHGLPPELETRAWRQSIPLYDGAGRQVGYATSGAWSPILKRNLALATVEPAFARTGAELRFETTVEHRRRTVRAWVVERPFFDPPRKRKP